MAAWLKSGIIFALGYASGVFIRQLFVDAWENPHKQGNAIGYLVLSLIATAFAYIVSQVKEDS